MNLDGNSSLRRTCNLSFACNYETSFTDYYWTMNTKFKLLFGLKNYINSNYPEIIWFKLGTYVITSFSYNYSTSGMNVSISGKDKMCLINGDVGGEIYASVDFGTREEIDSTTGTRELVDINIEDIIREAVHEYGHEPWENIIIRDLPKYGLFLLEWTGDTPIYVLIPTDGSDEAIQAYINGDIDVYVVDEAEEKPISELESYLTTNELTLVDKTSYTVIKTDSSSEMSYQVCRILPGQSAGYDVTELTYPRSGEESGLITSVGDSVTNVLDKIIDFLGNYEYFFNVDGQFIFQKKDKWIDTNWNSNDFDATGMGNDYTLTSILNTSWMFEGSELVTDFNNSPNIGNIKNDFTIWGERENGDTTIPIHMRYAVDKKPVFYKSVSYTAAELTAFKKLHPEFVNMDTSSDWPSYIYCTEDCPASYIPVGVEIRREDWRELIYQMALDYRRFNHFDTFNARILQANTVPNGTGGQDVLYPKGITGYEQYYVDLEGFWRYLYRPEYDEGTTLGYSIKNGDELDEEQNIYIRDHWYNISNKPTNGEFVEYYVTSIQPPETPAGTKAPYLIENPRRLGIKNFFNNTAYLWEGKASSDNWDWDSSIGADNYLQIPSNLTTTTKGNRGIQIDNGAQQDVKYDRNGFIISSEYPDEYRTDKYVLVINYREDVTYAELENIERLPLDTQIGFNYIKFNSYTVYKTENDEYYMLNKIRDQDGGSYFTYYLKFRVKMPTMQGTQIYDSERQVYRFNLNNVKENGSGTNIYSRVTTLKAIPSTFTYLDFTALPNEKILENCGCQVYQEFSASPMYNFPDGNEFEHSALYLSTENGQLDLNEEPDYVKGLMINYLEDYCSNYSYIAFDKCNIPILDDYDDYTYTHSPIAYYQETYTYNNGQDQSVDNNWNVLKNESPELLIFWFDFLDSQTSEIGKYGVNNVMDRSKASNESNVKAIYYRDSLNIVWERTSNTSERYKKLIDYTRSGYNIMQCGDWIYDYFKVANCGKSCKDVLDEWLQAYTQANESVSISCIPIYTLEPNNRITIHDDNVKINGEYVINSISIPLTYNGTMSINATKAVDKLY